MVPRCRKHVRHSCSYVINTGFCNKCKGKGHPATGRFAIKLSPICLLSVGRFRMILQDWLFPWTTFTSKGKAVLLRAWSGPQGFRKLRFPDFMTTAQDGGKVVSLTHRPPLPPGNTPGTHFCWRLSRPQGHNATGRDYVTKKFQWHHRESNSRPAGL
jgi:hypothetical protein